MPVKNCANYCKGSFPEQLKKKIKGGVRFIWKWSLKRYVVVAVAAAVLVVVYNGHESNKVSP